MSNRIGRCDAEASSIVDTSDGGIIVPVRVAKVGVRDYIIFDWTSAGVVVVKEAITAEELFKKETMDSLKGVVATLGHPWNMINNDNWNYYTRGFTIGDPYREDVEGESYLTVDVKVMDEETVAYIKSGIKDGTSAGYSCNLVEEQGDLNGERYDAKNTDIMYNHVAFCKREDARGGEDLGVRKDTLDEGIAQGLRAEVGTLAAEMYSSLRKDTKGGEIMETKVMRLDVGSGSKEFTVPTEVSNHVDGLEAKVKNAQEKYDALEAERDGIKLQLGEGQAKITELQARLDSIPSTEKLIAKINVANKVAEITGKTADYNADTKTLHLDALSTKYPEEKEVLAGKSADYLEVRFDMMIKELDAKGTSITHTKVDKKDTNTSDIVGGAMEGHWSQKK